MSIQVVLPESLTIPQIDSAYTGLLESFSTPSETIQIDASALESIDTSGLQSLLVLIQNAKQNGCQIEWISTTETLTQSAAKLGITQALNLQ